MLPVQPYLGTGCLSPLAGAPKGRVYPSLWSQVCLCLFPDVRLGADPSRLELETPGPCSVLKAQVSFIILTIKCRVFLLIQSYKLFVLICSILEGEFNNVHTFSFINLSVIRELAHGRK